MRNLVALILFSLFFFNTMPAQAETFGPGERSTYWSYDRVPREWNSMEKNIDILESNTADLAEQIGPYGVTFCDEGLQLRIKKANEDFAILYQQMQDRMKENQTAWRPLLSKFNERMSKIERFMDKYKTILQNHFGRRDEIGLIDACIKYRTGVREHQEQPQEPAQQPLQPENTELHPPDIRNLER